MNHGNFDSEREVGDVFATAGEFKVDRSVYNELQFSRNFKKPTEEDGIKKKIVGYFPDVKCSRSTLIRFIFSILPVLNWLPKYDVKQDLIRDVAGGLTVGIMQIPQGIYRLFPYFSLSLILTQYFDLAQFSGQMKRPAKNCNLKHV